MIKMDALKQMYAALGFNDIQTYIQSGNVIFRDKKTKAQELEKKIAKKILEQFGFEVPVMVKEVDELKTIAKNNPFVKDKSKDTTRMYLTFLSAAPDKTLFSKLKEGQYGQDEFELVDKTIYLYCPVSYGNSKMSNNFFESKLKLTATTRNWKTTNELIAIAENAK